MAVTKRSGERRKCAQCGSSLRPKDRFCPSCGAPVGGESRSESASLQVTGKRESSLAEQRKVVTVVFADLTGSTPLAERLDPEELRGILGSYFNVLARQIQRYEGTIDKYIGDAVMAVFGAPVSHEDDAERAISAALAMQGSIAKLNDDLDARHGVRLALRIGINTGEVVAGLLAGDVQAAYTVVGDTVNTAQRFEAAATPGDILVSRTTRELATHSFEFEATAPLVLKGKAQPVEAYRVVGRRYEEIDPEATPFVGRPQQLERLRSAADAAAVGRGSVVHVTGEAGVGKSRLVGELRKGLAAGIERLTVRSASFERNSPYALVGGLLRAAFRLRDTDDAGTARTQVVASLQELGRPAEEMHVGLLLGILGYPDQTKIEPEKMRPILLHLIRELLRVRAARGAFVITAEDLHWADDASVAILRDIVSDIPTLPCLFLTTSRPEWSPGWSSEQVAVDALTREEARSFAAAVFGVPVEEELVLTILARTSGNPFFIEEVIRQLKASLLLVERTGRVGLRSDAVFGVPATVQEVLEARIDRLEGGVREVLGTASVIGHSFWYRVLERLIRRRSLHEDVAALEDENLIAVRVVEPELTYAFRQALIQEVAYHTQLLSGRRETHGRVAQAVEALFAGRLDEFTDVLAYHYARSDDTAKAVEWLVRAGDRARRLYANDEAIRSYEEALALGGSPAARVAALEGLGDVHATLGHLDTARERYAEALALTVAGTASRARLERKTGSTYHRAGDYQQTLEWLERAQQTLGDQHDPELAAVAIDVAHVRWRQGRYDDAIAAAQRGTEEARLTEARQILAEGYKHLGTAHVLKGDHTSGEEHYRQALAIYQSLDDLQGLMNVHNNLGILLRRQARLDEALVEQDRALELARRIGEAWGTGMVLANMAETYRNRRDIERALRANEEALATWSQVGNAVGIATVHMNIGILQFEQGRLDEARASLQLALSEWEKLDSKLFLPELYRTLAKVELAGDPQKALGWAQRSLDVAREIKARDEEGVALQVLGAVQRALGDPAAAIAALRESVEILRTGKARLELAQSLSALADLVREDAPGEATTLGREAASILEGLAAPTGG